MHTGIVFTQLETTEVEKTCMFDIAFIPQHTDSLSIEKTGGGDAKDPAFMK